jgi:exodeoxyribonuclease VII large subunit
MAFQRAELPFDEVPTGAPSVEAATVRAVSLTRLYAEIGRAVAVPGRVQVEGDVHDRRVTQQGAIWFTLRDRAVDLPVLISGGRAKRSRIVDGERVSVVGRVTLQQRKLQLRMEAEEVTPVGEGAVAALIAQVRARLGAEGFLDRQRRPIPMLPAGIGVVCGTDAAVRRDIESVVAARFPGFPVRFLETSVQGAGAADAVRRAIDDLVADRGVDVIILARGGGSAVDLLPFSDEELCRAVASCSKAVVSAIGHDGDRPVCDDVADLRCGTPSIAAQMVIPDLASLRDRLERARLDCERSSARHLAAGQRSLEAIRWDSALDRRCAALRRSLSDIRWSTALDLRVDRERAVLASIPWGDRVPARCSAAQRMLEAIDPAQPLRQRIGESNARLALLGARMHALSPSRVLERGYAVVRTSDGRVLRRADDTSSGEQLDITLAAGQISVEVYHVR